MSLVEQLDKELIAYDKIKNDPNRNTRLYRYNRRANIKAILKIFLEAKDIIEDISKYPRVVQYFGNLEDEGEGTMLSNLKQLKQKVRNLTNGDYTGYYVADVTPEEWSIRIEKLKEEQAKSLKAKREKQDIEYQKNLKSNFQKIMEDMNKPNFFETLSSGGGNGKDQVERTGEYSEYNSYYSSSPRETHKETPLETLLKQIMEYVGEDYTKFEPYANINYLNLWINLSKSFSKTFYQNQKDFINQLSANYINDEREVFVKLRKSQEQYKLEKAQKLEQLKAVEERKKEENKIATIDKINSYATRQAQQINTDYKSDMDYYKIPQYHCTNSSANILPAVTTIGGRKRLKKKRKTKGRKKMIKKKTIKRRYI